MENSGLNLLHSPGAEVAAPQGPSVSVLQVQASLHSPQGSRGSGVLVLTKYSYGVEHAGCFLCQTKCSNEAIIQRIGAKP